MAKRPDTATAQLKVRLREPLRARLEAEADRNGYSLNTEIVRRLEASIRDEDIGAVLFGDRDLYHCMDALARLVRAVEMHEGKLWLEDRATYNRAVDTIHAFLKGGPAFVVTGEWPGGIRGIADAGALMAVEQLFVSEAGRQKETSRDQRFARWWQNVQSDGLDRLFKVQPGKDETIEEARERAAWDCFLALEKSFEKTVEPGETTDA
jgi:hypothetical protein